MNPSATHSESTIDAGHFGAWLLQARAALRGNGGMDVPCGDCVGCCTSGYSIFLRPHDKAIEVVPAKYQSSVTGLAYPHAKMNPLANGHCPMFSAGKCSIYASRPQTCLDYDCRIFAAAGIDAGPLRPVINQRVKAWTFTFHSEEERAAHRAIKAAADFITRNAQQFPDKWNASAPSAVAVLAIKSYEVFLDEDVAPLDSEEVLKKVTEAVHAFDKPA